MWFDDQADQRIGRDRVQEIIQTRAEIVAVSCPFCMTMTTDGLSAQDSDMQVKDIAELLHEAVTKR